MLILGIETTCDETAAAVVARDEGARSGRILSNVVRSQIEEHAEYGGVVPEIAARAHVDLLDEIVGKAIADAGVRRNALHGIAAAGGPGLIGGVMVGVTYAKAMALALERPFIAVNHLEGHALTPRLTDGVAFPYLLLLASGGHTQLVAVLDVGRYKRIGTTVDDALGEAFDKVAKMLGLAYPGGPEVERWAASGDPQRFTLPRPMMGRAEPDFSLAGLKTAVRLAAQKAEPLSDGDVSDLCASFQMAAMDIVVDRTRVGIKRFQEYTGAIPTALVIAGGVASNQSLRRGLQKLADDSGIPLIAPPPALCTDNGAMIAWAGAERLLLGLHDGLDFASRPRWPLDAAAAAPGAKA
jgi:N6-L-threonylcarbamoyladenine synthase